MSKEYVRLSIEEVMNIASNHMEEDAVHAQVVLDFAAEIEKEVISRCRAQGGITSDNIPQAAANKAAEEGGLPVCSVKGAENMPLCVGGCAKRGVCNERAAADRASRQVANKAPHDIWGPEGEFAEFYVAGFKGREICPTIKGNALAAYSNGIKDRVANKAEVEPKPFAYVKFCAAEQLTSEGGIDSREWYEFCDQSELGDDKLPAFPLYATPPATTGAMPKDLAIQCLNALDVDSEAHAALSKFIIEGGTTGASTGLLAAIEALFWEFEKGAAPFTVKAALDQLEEDGVEVSINPKNAREIFAAAGLLEGSAGASTVLTDERIEKIWDSMPGQPGGFMKQFGYLQFAREVAAQAGQVAVPGWKMVPIEPTPEMQQAGYATIGAHMYNASYRAMVKAAPSPAKESK